MPKKKPSASSTPLAGTVKQDGDCGYVAMYKGQRKEVWATGSYQAQVRAAEMFGVSDKQRYHVTVTLAERADGSPVTHTPVD